MLPKKVSKKYRDDIEVLLSHYLLESLLTSSTRKMEVLLTPI